MELLFEKDGVRITPHVATFGDTSYQIANVANVHVTRRNRRNPVAFAVFLLGLALLIGAIAAARATGLPDDHFSMAAAGIGAMIAAVLLQTRLAGPPPCADLEHVRRRGGGDCVARPGARCRIFTGPLEEAFVARARQPVPP